MDPYFVRHVVYLKMCQPKYFDKQITPYSEQLIKIFKEMYLVLLPLVSNAPRCLTL